MCKKARAVEEAKMEVKKCKRRKDVENLCFIKCLDCITEYIFFRCLFKQTRDAKIDKRSRAKHVLMEKSL